MHYNATENLRECLRNLPMIHRVTPRVILRVNSDKYYAEKENLYGKTHYPE